MSQVQTLKTESGEELVVLTRAAYQHLLDVVAGAAFPAEDAADTELARTTRAALDRGDDVAIPMQVWEAMEARPHPLGPLRRWRAMTQAGLAAASGVAQPHISAIEAGKKRPGVAALRGLAAALRVPIDTLIPEA